MSTYDSYDPYAMPVEAVQDPPRSLWQALRKIGPGIIVAGSIVGSGELILTTSLGAEYGYVFLWLILFSCVIKVFVQVELGRYAISSGKPTLGAIDELPGPRLGTHWIVWWYQIMVLATISQLGAMTGLIGQALHLAAPPVSPAIASGLEYVAPGIAAAVRQRPEYAWAVLTWLTVVALLLSGGYRRVEQVAAYLVAAVTALTAICVLALPATEYGIRWDEVAEGFKFLVPAAGIALAFGTFGVTGVGATELFAYPYWCLEKGYARFAGRRDESEAWLHRARGWIRVMKLDAWCCMIVFTLATVAFYFMGAAVLHPQGLKPKGKDMIFLLSQMYVGPFGLWTQIVFLIGAAAVLFKTLYVACAGHSRLTADMCHLAGFVRFSDSRRRGRWVQVFCVGYATLALCVFLMFGEPRGMVVFGGIAQAATLPIISGITVYFRYRGTDRRLAPSRATDLALWLAFVSISLVAIYVVSNQVAGLVSGPSK